MFLFFFCVFCVSLCRVVSHLHDFLTEDVIQENPYLVETFFVDTEPVRSRTNQLGRLWQRVLPREYLQRVGCNRQRVVVFGVGLPEKLPESVNHGKILTVFAQLIYEPRVFVRVFQYNAEGFWVNLFCAEQGACVGCDREGASVAEVPVELGLGHVCEECGLHCVCACLSLMLCMYLVDYGRRLLKYITIVFFIEDAIKDRCIVP